MIVAPIATEEVLLEVLEVQSPTLVIEDVLGELTSGGDAAESW